MPPKRSFRLFQHFYNIIQIFPSSKNLTHTFSILYEFSSVSLCLTTPVISCILFPCRQPNFQPVFPEFSSFKPTHMYLFLPSYTSPQFSWIPLKHPPSLRQYVKMLSNQDIETPRIYVETPPPSFFSGNFF